MEHYIESTSKEIFFQSMKAKVYKDAFQSYLNMKEISGNSNKNERQSKLS